MKVYITPAEFERLRRADDALDAGAAIWAVMSEMFDEATLSTCQQAWARRDPPNVIVVPHIPDSGRLVKP